jgi:hypothetical protein
MVQEASIRPEFGVNILPLRLKYLISQKFLADAGCLYD